MLRFEKTICMRCGKTFIQLRGGVIEPAYKEDLCTDCRKDKYKGVWNKICGKRG